MKTTKIMTYKVFTEAFFRRANVNKPKMFCDQTTKCTQLLKK